MSNMKKIGTLLVTLVFFASVLAVVTPAGADGSRFVDVYFADATTVSDAAPTIGDNITITAKLQTVDENATGFDVTFTANSTAGQIPVSVIPVTLNVTNAAPFDVVGYWDSTVVIPDPDLVYDIIVSFSATGDTNTSNDTGEWDLNIDWKAPKIEVTAVAGADTGLIGDPYTVTVTIENTGDADYTDLYTVEVYKGGMGTALNSSVYNGTQTALAPAATADVDVILDGTTTGGFSAGDVNLTSGNMYKIVAFAEKVSNVDVTAIAFTPSAGVKHTQTVTITASLSNDGTMDAIDHVVTFAYGANTIGTVTLNVTMGDTPDAVLDWVTPSSSIQDTYTVNVSTADGNYLTENITLLPEPHVELAVSGIALAPMTLAILDEPDMTQDVTVTVTVANTGDLDAVLTPVKLMANGVDVDSQDVNITAGGTADVVFTYAAKTLEDDSEVNISASIGTDSDFKLLTVPGDKDLAAFEISALTFSPAAQQEAGLEVTITATVKNIGDAMAEEVTVTFLAGETEIGTADLVNVSTENTTTFVWKIPATQAIGDVMINATIDDVFLNESFKVIAFKKPVITIEFEKTKKDKVKTYSGEAEDGKKDSVKVKVIVDNTAGTAAANNVYITITDAKGKELGNATVASVASGATHEETIVLKLKAGSSGKMTASATYDGIHDDSYPAVSSTESAKYDIAVIPGFEAVLFVAALVVAVVFLSRRRK